MISLFLVQRKESEELIYFHPQGAQRDRLNHNRVYSLRFANQKNKVLTKKDKTMKRNIRIGIAIDMKTSTLRTWLINKSADMYIQLLFCLAFPLTHVQDHIAPNKQSLQYGPLLKILCLGLAFASWHLRSQVTDDIQQVLLQRNAQKWTVLLC